MRRTALWAVVGIAVCVAAPAPALGQSGSVQGIVHVRNARSEDAVVYLLTRNSPAPPTPTAEPALIDQRDIRFVPHVLPVLPGQAVAFRNSDPILHNVFGPDTLGEAFDLGTYPEGEWRVRTFQRAGAHVVLCHIHPEMEAYVIVIPTRDFGVADRQGRFRIEGVPPGAYTLHVWHRQAQLFRREITLGASDTLRLEIQLERRGRAAPRH